MDAGAVSPRRTSPRASRTRSRHGSAIPAAAPHGGESLAALIERAGAWLAQSLAREGATLAVTHASVVRAAIVNALGAGSSAFWRIDVAPLSLARLSGRDGRWNLVALGPLEGLS